MRYDCALFSIVSIIRVKMAGIGEMIALAATGLAINKRDPKPEIRNCNNKAKVERTNTTDIYTTNNSRKTTDTRESMGRDRFRDSRRFKDTGVIPRDYKGYEDWLKRNKNKKIRSVDFNEVTNFGRDRRSRVRENKNRSKSSSDSEFSDMESFDGSVNSTGSDAGYHGINMNRPESVIDRMSSITNNRKFESCVAKKSKRDRDKFAENDTWVHQFDQMTFDNPGNAVSSNSTAHQSGKHGHMARLETERQMEIDGGFSMYDANDDGTYGVTRADSPDFIHENMQPFVSRGPSARHEEARNDVNQRTLELFTGSADNVDYRPKVERAPLFSPLIGAQNIYGDPVRTDEYKERYFPGREKRNELPFSQVKVTPGLDIGYNSIGKQGYHDMYRVIPRGVDELRTLNNPKITYGSYVGPGQKEDKGPVLGKVSHYRAPTFRERGTNDMVRQAAQITAPTIYGEYDPKNLATVNRGVKETMKIGTAAADVTGNTPGKFRGNWRSSRKENYKFDAPRNVHEHEGMKGEGHNNKSFVPDMTKRNAHDRYDNPRNVHGHEEMKGMGHNNQSFVPDATKRNAHDRYDRAGNAVSNEVSGYKSVDWNDVADVTKRDIHNKYDRSGMAITGAMESIKAVDWNDVADVTKRDIHNKYDRSGMAITGEKEQIRAINWNDLPDVTKRDIHNKYDRSGLAVTGEKEQYVVFDKDDVPDPTKRNIHNKYDRSGLAVTGEREQYVVFDEDDVPDPTKRNIHNKYDRTGKAITGNRQNYLSINYDDVMDPTKRDIHNKYDRTGKAITGNRQNVHVVSWDDVPDATMRDIHNKYDRAGKAISSNKEQILAINYDDVMDPTKRDIHNKYDRTGKAITGNRQNVHVVSWDDVPDATMRDIHNKYDRAGKAISSNKEQIMAINYDDVMDPTKRDIHNKYDRTGKAITGNKMGYTSINRDDVPDATMRDIHGKYDRMGKAITGNKASQHYIDWSDIADPTMRDIHNKYDRAGHVSGNKNSSYVIDRDDVPDATMRDIHGKYDRMGKAITGDTKSYYIDRDDVPDPTMREIHPGGRAGGAHSHNKRQGSRHKYMVMKTNAGKEALEEGRAPTKIGMEKSWTIDMTAFRHKELVEGTWRPGPGADTMYTNDSLESVNTKVPVGRFYINDRIQSFTAENLEGNGLVNNVIHRSVNFDKY
jgi:hypothetical protein